MRGLICLSIAAFFFATLPLRGVEKEPSDEEEAEVSVTTLIADLKAKRRDAVHEKLTQLDKLKTDLRESMIKDDKVAIPALKKSIETNQRTLRDLLAAPLSTDKLDLKMLRKGQVGTFSLLFKIREVLQQSANGEAIIVPKTAALDLTLKVSGVNTTNFVENGDFPSKGSFVVVGMFDYAPETGIPKTVFELTSLANDTVFDEKELKLIKTVAEKPISVVLTKEELAKSEELQETRAAELAKEKEMRAAELTKQKELREAELAKEKEMREAEIAKQKKEKEAKEAEAAKKIADQKAKKAQSYLDSAKILLKKDNYSGARKQLEKAIEESPDSDVGKAAQKLLDKIP